MTAFFEDVSGFLGTGEKNEKGQDLAEFLEEYDPYKYKNPCVTTDAAVFSYKEEAKLGSEWKLLLIKRKNHPSIGWWALPGGFIDLMEDIDLTAQRELSEETQVEDLILEQFAVYGEAKRDPRARVITAVYMAVVEESKVHAKAGDDAAEAEWFSIHTEQEVCADGTIFHHIQLLQIEKGIQLSAIVSEKTEGTLIQKKEYKVVEKNGIACDHAAILLQAWEILKSRLSA